MHCHYADVNLPSADCLTTINKLRSENLKSLLGTLTEAVESEVTESLKKIGKTEPQNPTAKTIAVKLAGNDIQSCESGESAKATTVGLLGFEYCSVAALR